MTKSQKSRSWRDTFQVKKFLPHGLLFTILRGLCTGGTPQTWVPKRTTGICPFSVAIWNFKGHPTTVAFTGITTGAKSETYGEKHEYTNIHWSWQLSTKLIIIFLNYDVNLSDLIPSALQTNLHDVLEDKDCILQRRERVILKAFINCFKYSTDYHTIHSNLQS